MLKKQKKVYDKKHPNGCFFERFMFFFKKESWLRLFAFVAVAVSCGLCAVSRLWTMAFCLFAPVVMADFLCRHINNHCADESETFDWRNN